MASAPLKTAPSSRITDRPSDLLIVAGLVFATLSWLLPGHYPPWTAFQQQAVATLALACIMTAALVRRDRSRWPLSTLAIAAAVLATVPLLQLATGTLHFVDDGVLPAAYLAGFACALGTGQTMRRQHADRWIGWLFASIVVAGIASAGIAFAQTLSVTGHLFVVDMPPGGRPYANLAQPNHLATLLCMTLACAVTAYEMRWLGGATVALLSAYTLVGIAATHSRTAWLFLAVAVVWWALKRRRLRLRTPVHAIVIALSLFGFTLSSWDRISTLLPIGTEPLEAHLRVNIRPQHWAVLWDAVLQRPWTGYGWLNVSAAQQAAALAHPATGERLDDSHNAVLDLFVWAGLPVGLAFTLFVAWWLARAAQRCADAGNWGLLLASSAILVHALVEYPLDYLFFLLTLGLLLGSLGSFTVAKGQIVVSKAVPTVALSLLSLLSVWVCAEYLLIEESSRRLRFNLAYPSVSGLSSLTVPDVVLLEGPREYQRFWLSEARQGMPAAQIDWMADVVRRNAAPPAMLRYAAAAGLNGRPTEARRMLALICKIQPEENCAQGRESWQALQSKYPELREIRFPD